MMFCRVWGLREALSECSSQRPFLGAFLGSRLRSHDPNRVEVYRLESRVLEIERRIYYFAKRIAKTVISPSSSPLAQPPLEKAISACLPESL